MRCPKSIGHGLDRLMFIARRPDAASWAEALWWRCHRRHRYLLLHGRNVLHQGRGELSTAAFATTEGERLLESNWSPAAGAQGISAPAADCSIERRWRRALRTGGKRQCSAEQNPSFLIDSPLSAVATEPAAHVPVIVESGEEVNHLGVRSDRVKQKRSMAMCGLPLHAKEGRSASRARAPASAPIERSLPAAPTGRRRSARARHAGPRVPQPGHREASRALLDAHIRSRPVRALRAAVTWRIRGGAKAEEREHR